MKKLKQNAMILIASCLMVGLLTTPMKNNIVEVNASPVPVDLAPEIEGGTTYCLDFGKFFGCITSGTEVMFIQHNVHASKVNGNYVLKVASIYRIPHLVDKFGASDLRLNNQTTTNTGSGIEYSFAYPYKNVLRADGRYTGSRYVHRSSVGY